MFGCKSVTTTLQTSDKLVKESSFKKKKKLVKEDGTFIKFSLIETWVATTKCLAIIIHEISLYCRNSWKQCDKIEDYKTNDRIAGILTYIGTCQRKISSPKRKCLDFDGKCIKGECWS